MTLLPPQCASAPLAPAHCRVLSVRPPLGGAHSTQTRSDGAQAAGMAAHSEARRVDPTTKGPSDDYPQPLHRVHAAHFVHS